MGFPITVLPDGSLRLPDLRPVDARGLTISQVADKIRKEYLDADVLRDTEGKQVSPIVTLIRKRQVSVVVVRQDLGGTGEQGARGGVFNQRGYIRGADQSASGALIKLDADEADVLHALMASGGLPGVNAKNEVKILRANRADRRKYDEFVAEFFRRQADELRPCECPPALPEDPSILRIPLRVKPGEIPDFRPEDIALQRGDVVYIESRDAEVFYTGGKLPGGEWAIPRDYDLDVLGAMAIAGAGFGSTGPGGGGGFNIFLALGQIPPSRLFVIRKTPCNGQVIIEVDLGEAINDPRQRPLVQPGDTLVLQYKPEEEILNFSLGTFFTFGIQQLIREVGR
jgi:protein involved in polysaccharide export with SLBB domain